MIENSCILSCVRLLSELFLISGFMGVDPRLKKKLTNHIEGRLETSDLSENQQKWIRKMAEDPTQFLGEIAGGVGTPQELIVERLLDQFTPLLKEDMAFEDVRDYLERGMNSSEQIKSLIAADLSPSDADQSVEPSDLEDLGFSSTEAKKLQIDYRADMTVGELFLEDEITRDQVNQLLEDPS